MKNKILIGVLLIAIVVIQVDTWRIRHEIKSYDRAIDTVNIGTTANDGTGDPLRTAFIKVNAGLYQLDTGKVNVSDTSAMLTPYALLSEALTNPMTTAGDMIYGGASGVPTRLATGITGAEIMTTESLTDVVLIHVGDTTVTAVVGKIVFQTSDATFYGCIATSGKKWEAFN